MTERNAAKGTRQSCEGVGMEEIMRKLCHKILNAAWMKEIVELQNILRIDLTARMARQGWTPSEDERAIAWLASIDPRSGAARRAGRCWLAKHGS